MGTPIVLYAGIEGGTMWRYLLVLAAFVLPFLGFGQAPKHVQGQILAQLNQAEPQHVIDEFRRDYLVESLSIERQVSTHLDIWLFTFDHNEVCENEILTRFRKSPNVSVAQFNLLVEERDTTPNDVEFPSQWHHQEEGDHDIDSELAWDMTTGGFTATGDRIVVCVIELGGADWDHVDLIDNHWINEGEIESNGYDDDGNGYIDDYHGWNAEIGTDEIPTGNHGTRVSSMIGARGDNEIGIAGVNWDVGLMQVVVDNPGGAGNVDQAAVLAAYDYPLTMRMLYNESGGQEGAFVVATNASWGTDFGDPETDGPLWCAMFDTLGEHGILNCGATANNNVNIDEVGDLPTACDSDYMVSVTATNNQDVRSFSGYGVETIDLAAPGENVWLASNGGYTGASGTSYASPCVAGVIALMYSVGCDSFMEIVWADPQTGADLVREALFAGVDLVPNLADEVATGGRVNAFNSLQYLMDNCINDECLPPFALSVEDDEPSEYVLTWAELGTTVSVDLRYRIVGTSEWTVLNDLEDSEAVLSDLEWCETYEFQVRSNCETYTSEWTDSFTFETDGCCEAPDFESLEVVQLSETDALISWDPVLAALNYDLEYAVQGSGDWTAFPGVINTQVFLSGLTPCEFYEVRVRTVCENETTGWSQVIEFITLGCQDCSNLEYCEISGSAAAEWIEGVELNTINNQTVSDSGYGDYTDLTTTLFAGETYSMTVTPGYDSFQWSEVFRVWIDFNGNEEFEDTEMIVQTSPTTTPVLFSFTVPYDAPTGPGRMRVSMDYSTNSGGGALPVECGDLDFGEAEDYCILIEGLASSVEELSTDAWQLAPNPAREYVTLLLEDPILFAVAQIHSVEGRLVHEAGVRSANQIVDIQGLPSGLYVVTLISQDGARESKRLAIER